MEIGTHQREIIVEPLEIPVPVEQPMQDHPMIEPLPELEPVLIPA